ncbi:MAG: hypothetical protein ACRYGA_14995 [Janthinobacterium lividum]
MPPLVPEKLRQLGKALADVAVKLRPIGERLLLAGFASVDPAACDVLAATVRRPVPSFEEFR